MDGGAQPRRIFGLARGSTSPLREPVGTEGARRAFTGDEAGTRAPPSLRGPPREVLRDFGSLRSGSNKNNRLPPRVDCCVAFLPLKIC